jgi:hypothetical protein
MNADMSWFFLTQYQPSLVQSVVVHFENSNQVVVVSYLEGINQRIHLLQFSIPNLLLFEGEG